MSRKSNTGGGRKSVSRKSVSRKSVSRKSKAGGKRKSSVRRQSSKGGHHGKKSHGETTSAEERAKMRHPMYHIKQYLSNPENLEAHYAFYKELLQKKDDLVNYCVHGRKRFVDWLAAFLRAEGMVVEVREMPAHRLDIYGPDGPPAAVLAYPLNPDPNRWTMCIFGRYEQVEERIKDPALLFNGRICHRRRPPETWGVLATWLATFKALSITRQPLPVNIKMCFTALQTDDAPTMVKFIESIRNEFLRFVDFFAYATTLSVTTLPGGVAYSGRGVCHFVMDISDGNPAPEICSSLTGPLRQTAHDAVHLLDDLEKDCVYSHLNMFEDFILPHRFLKLVRRVYVRDLQPIKGFFYRKKVLEVKEKRAADMWRPVVALQDIQAFSQHMEIPNWNEMFVENRAPKLEVMLEEMVRQLFFQSRILAQVLEPMFPLKIPSRLVIRFSVKYMTEASPAQVEDMVNRMLCKKWLDIESELSCRLSMDYWARPWYAVNKNRLYRPIKKAALRAFHQCPTEALDFAPNSLPSILQRLIPEDFIMIILSSMPDMNHHRFRKNLKRNMKFLCGFLFEVAKAKTEKTFSWNWNKGRKRTRPYRIRHKKMEKRWRPPVDPDQPEEEPTPVLPPEEYTEEGGKRSGSRKPKESKAGARRASKRQSKVSNKRQSKVSNKRQSKASIKRQSKVSNKRQSVKRKSKAK